MFYCTKLYHLMMGNLISCICVTFNRYNNLRFTINAFTNQTYLYKELVIIDDSTNRIPKDIEELIKQNNNIKYTKLIKRESIGYKRNKAVCLSTGTYIAIWDDDDIHFENRLTRQMKHIQKKKSDISVVSHNVLYYFPLEQKFKRIPRKDHDNWWYHGITCPSMMFKKKLWYTTKYPNINKHEDLYFLKNLPHNTVIHTDTSKHNPYFAYTVNNDGVSLISSYLLN